MKTIRSVSVDVDLFALSKKAGLNLSNFLNQALTVYFNNYKNQELHSIEELNSQILENSIKLSELRVERERILNKQNLAKSEILSGKRLPKGVEVHKRLLPKQWDSQEFDEYEQVFVYEGKDCFLDKEKLVYYYFDKNKERIDLLWE